jgi:preprotein translocase subunit YajC
MRRNHRKVLSLFEFRNFLLNAAVILVSTLASIQGVFADGAVPAGSPAVAGGAPAQPGFSSMMVPFALMFGVIYFLMIRPQQKKMKDQQSMMSQLKQGDDILTNSGILGKVTEVSDKIVTVEVADRVRVKMLKSQVAQVIKEQQLKELA